MLHAERCKAAQGLCVGPDGRQPFNNTAGQWGSLHADRVPIRHLQEMNHAWA